MTGFETLEDVYVKAELTRFAIIQTRVKLKVPFGGLFYHLVVSCTLLYQHLKTVHYIDYVIM